MPTRTADAFRAKQYDVFVSYSHFDADVRDIFVEALQEAKLSVWWDAKLMSGAWRPQLAHRIVNCKLVVALWSKQVAGAPDEVGDEMAQARGLDRLMVLRTDAAQIPKRFQEQNFMAFDCWADPAKRGAHLEAIVEKYAAVSLLRRSRSLRLEKRTPLPPTWSTSWLGTGRHPLLPLTQLFSTANFPPWIT